MSDRDDGGHTRMVVVGDAPTWVPEPGDGVGPLVQAAGPRYLPIPGTLRRVEDRELVDARDPRIDRIVTLHRSQVPLDEAGAGRFMRGEFIAARLDHPGATCVLAIGRDDDGHAFFVTPRRQTTELSRWCRGAAGEAPPTLGRRLTAMAEVCRVIGHAHRNGVVHGRLTPNRVQIGEIGEVTIDGWGHATLAAGALLFPADLVAADQLSATVSDDLDALLGVLAIVLDGDVLLAPELGQLTASPDGGATGVASAADLTRRLEQFLDGERNLELRARAAAGQLEIARAALASGAGRSEVALNAARLALALAPSNQRAAAIVARLMVEVPDPLPPAALRAADRSDQRVIRDMGIAVIAAFTAFFAYVGIMFIQGVRGPDAVVAIATMTAIMLVWAIHWRTVGPHVFSWPAMLGTAAVLTLYARTMGPFINAPAQAALATLAVSLFPRAPRPAAILATFAVPVLGTYLLEATGLLVTTTTVEGGALWIDSPVVRLDEVETFIGLVVVTIVLVTVAASMAGRVASSHARDMRALLVQRWKILQIAAGDSDGRVGSPPADPV